MTVNSQDLKIALLELVTLTAGDRGEEVKKLQHTLNALGYDCGEVDGWFSDRTQAAVVAVQRHFGLQPDGRFGPSTWYALSFWAQEEQTTSVEAFIHPWQQIWSRVSGWLRGKSRDVDFSYCASQKPRSWIP